MPPEKPKIKESLEKAGETKEKFEKFFRVMVLATAASVTMAGYGAETAQGQSRRTIGQASRTAENLYGEFNRRRLAEQIEKLKELDRQIQLLKKKFEETERHYKKELIAGQKSGNREEIERIKKEMAAELDALVAQIEKREDEADELEQKIRRQQQKSALVSTALEGFRRIMRGY